MLECCHAVGDDRVVTDYPLDPGHLTANDAEAKSTTIPAQVIFYCYVINLVASPITAERNCTTHSMIIYTTTRYSNMLHCAA
jgi:hypothetical protein